MMPSKILDLHTHVFNARSLPLASIIADAMKKDSSLLATLVARLLYFLTGSSYESSVFSSLQARTAGMAVQEDTETYIDAIWAITERELIATTQSEALIEGGPAAMATLTPGSLAAQRMDTSELMALIRELDQIDYLAEGWIPDEDDPAQDAGILNVEFAPDSLALRRAEKAVKRAFRRLGKLMDPDAWGRYTNYIEFFFTLLSSERRMLDRLIDGYGYGLPPLRFVHFMMDMQLAYPSKRPPYYAPYPEQMQRMQQLQRDSQGALLGFWAFDPRREQWRTWAEQALAKGFLGFKFYPAMGYRPDGDEKYAQVIEDFYQFCVEKDVPIFAHCTPEGFQTRREEGHFANPSYWETVLSRWPTLRLCLGHAGGGKAGKGEKLSHGWDAVSEAEWSHPNNYAYRVVTLCKRYPNVYCEVGHLAELLGETGRKRFLDNLARAEAIPGEYAFLHKLAYGTDWHMHTMISSTRRFLDGFLSMFSDPLLAPYTDHFFWKNGYTYLKLPE
ncbi:amidohydrolase family protein [Pseudoxanthomonas wuyuanensis]|nr:amidohydrolase family protein [Pseudoxanthomonas wuyuanensis]